MRHRRKWIASSAVLALVLVACGVETASTRSPRAPGSALARPSPETSAVAFPSVSPSAFRVAASDEADALFSRPDTCTNVEVGYTVTFPDDWYTNTAIGDQAACSWFTPDFFEVDVPGEVPEEVWISIDLVDGLFAYNMLTAPERSEELVVDGYAGHRSEYEDRIESEPSRLTYHYVVPFGSAGPTLIARTDVDMADHYELAKAVLDRLMASMELDPLIGGVPTIPAVPTGTLIDGPPVRREDSDGTFRLTLEASQDRFRAGQPIEVVASVTYLGPDEATVVRGSSHSLIGFSVESVELPLQVQPIFTSDCAPHDFFRDAPVEFPFTKSGGFDDGDPFAPFYRSYFASDVLRLPAGTWTIAAGGSFYIGDCGDELHELSTSVTIRVEP